MKKIGDFYGLVKAAKSRQDISRLLRAWNGDPRLRLAAEPSPILIAPEAFLKSKSGRDSLEHIFFRSRHLEREIPYTCLIDERQRIIVATLIGVIGNFGFCWWEKGNLLVKSFEAASRAELRVMLGHTHPGGYGAICSNIYNHSADHFGGDYTEMLEWMRGENLVSRFHTIMSPRENQMGIFELASGGVVKYHPWKMEISLSPAALGWREEEAS